MKQAVATGWNCTRAKILVKLRENMSEDSPDTDNRKNQKDARITFL